MELIFILLVIFVGGGWLLGTAIGSILFPKKQSNKPVKTEIHHHHYHTENHLHVSQKEFEALKKGSKNT